MKKIRFSVAIWICCIDGEKTAVYLVKILEKIYIKQEKNSLT